MNLLERITPSFIKRMVRGFVQYLSGYSPEIQEHHRKIAGLEERTRHLSRILRRHMDAFRSLEREFHQLKEWVNAAESRSGGSVHETKTSFKFQHLDYSDVSDEGCLIESNRFQLVLKKEIEHFPGGIYNPGVVGREGRYYLLARAEKYAEIERAQDFDKMMEGSVPLLVTCDSDMKVIESCELEPVNFPSKQSFRIEDFRLMLFRGEVYAHHPVVFFPSSFGFLKSKQYRADQAISRVNFEEKKLELIGFPRLDRKTASVEKNWTFLERDGALYLFYAFYPHFVVKRLLSWEDLEFQTVHNEWLSIPGLEGFSYLSYSSSPVVYDENHYLLIVHARRSSTILDYLHWGVLIDRKTLRPAKMTRCPIVRGGTARGIYKHVVFVTAVLPDADDFIFVMGEGDFYSSFVRVSKKILEENWALLTHSGIQPNG